MDIVSMSTKMVDVKFLHVTYTKAQGFQKKYNKRRAIF